MSKSLTNDVYISGNSKYQIIWYKNEDIFTLETEGGIISIYKSEINDVIVELEKLKSLVEEEGNNECVKNKL